MTSAGIARAPYEIRAIARVCRCTLPAQSYGTARILDRAIERAAGYWNVMVAFYGDQVLWLHWEVVDLRDGTVVWRDGLRMKGTAHGENPSVH